MDWERGAPGMVRVPLRLHRGEAGIQHPCFSPVRSALTAVAAALAEAYRQLQANDHDRP
jgi:hypothetical protein